MFSFELIFIVENNHPRLCPNKIQGLGLMDYELPIFQPTFGAYQTIIILVNNCVTVVNDHSAISF